MKKRFDDKGIIKVIVLIALAVALIFVAFSFGKPYFRYYTLSSHTRDILVTNIGDVKNIRTRILAEVSELNVPLDEENLEVSIDQKKIVRVNAAWSETVDFFGYYQKKIDLSINEEY